MLICTAMKTIMLIGVLLAFVGFNAIGSGETDRQKNQRISFGVGYAHSSVVNDVTNLLIKYGYDDPTTGWLFNPGEIIEHPKFSGPRIFASGSYTNYLNRSSAIAFDLNYTYAGELSGYGENKGYLFIRMHSFRLAARYTYRPFKRLEISLGPLLAFNSGDDVGAESKKYGDTNLGVDSKITFILKDGQTSFWGLFVEYALIFNSDLGPYDTSEYTTVYTIPVSKVNFSTLHLGLCYGFKF